MARLRQTYVSTHLLQFVEHSPDVLHRFADSSYEYGLGINHCLEGV